MTTDTHTVPDEHSDVVGGSSASRRINCPRSYTLEKMVPPDPGSSYAREGTALHEMMALILDKDKDPKALLPYTFRRVDHPVEGTWEVTVDENLWYELGQPALDAFDDFIDEIETRTGAEFDYVIETRCAMPGVGEGQAFGTSDVIWSCGDLSGIWDWKFGRGPVSADSDQLRFYARAAASTIPHMFGPVGGVEGNDNAGKFSEIDQSRTIILSIMQPQVSDDPSHHEVTVEELEDFRKTLAEAVTEALTQGENARCEKGGWCAFATCKAVCPHWGGRSATFGAKMARLNELKEEQGAKKLRDVENTDVTYIDEDEEGEFEYHPDFLDMLPELLDLAEVAKEWADEVFAAAQRALTEGDHVEGWKLKDKRSAGREFKVSEEEVKAFMKNRRYKLDDYMPRKLLTMPQCEKLLKRDGRVIPEEMVRQKPSSGTTMVRADHPAPAVEMSADRAKSLGDKLSRLASRDED